MMNSASDNTFFYFEKKEKEFVRNIIKEIRNEYEQKDKEIFSSLWRKKNGYIPHGLRPRTVITIFGKITYSRHRYKIYNGTKWEFVYLADKILGIEKYQRINNHLKIKILNFISKGKRYQDIIDCFPNADLKCQTISNLIKKTNFSNLVSKKSAKIEAKNNLYINLDDTFLNLKIKNKGQKFRFRVISVYTDFCFKNNKKFLLNKKIFYIMAQSHERFDSNYFFDFLKKIIYENYQIFFDTNVIISGDGASWIRQVANKWENSFYIVDKFHMLRKFKYLFNPKNENFTGFYSNLKYFLSTGDYESIMKILESICFLEQSKNSLLQDLKTYVKFNKIGIINQKNENNIGCSIESVISHDFKSLLGYGAKTFNYQNYQKILDLHISYKNQDNIIELLKQKIIFEHNNSLREFANKNS